MAVLGGWVDGLGGFVPLRLLGVDVYIEPAVKGGVRVVRAAKRDTSGGNMGERLEGAFHTILCIDHSIALSSLQAPVQRSEIELLTDGSEWRVIFEETYLWRWRTRRRYVVCHRYRSRGRMVNSADAS